MKRILIAVGLLFALLPEVVLAQTTVSAGAGGFTGGDVTGQTNVCGPDNVTNVEIGSCTNDANAGIGGTSTVIGNAAASSGNSAGGIVIGSSASMTATGANNIVIGPSRVLQGTTSGSVTIGSGGTCNTSGNNLVVIGNTAVCAVGTSDSFIVGGTATNTASNQFVAGANGFAYTDVYFGEGVANTSAVGFTLRATGGSGADNAGGALTIAPGIGTGTAVGGQVVLQRAQRNATGSAAQPLKMAWVSCPVKILSTTSATVQPVATITTTSVSGGSVTADFSTTACSATVCNTDGGIQKIGWRNAAGTVTAATSAIEGQLDVDASGTLATTPTATVATNVVTYNFTPTWATIVPTAVFGYVNFLVNSLDSVVCQ